jgi:hypothetical protein
MALAVGLNAVSGAAYGGWEGPLTACEFDARDMAAIASANGFESKQLLTAQATRDAVLGEIRRAADTLKSGDIFMLSYSGHGGQLTDFTGDEFDGKDETWCLFDGELIDDELDAEWPRFKPAVRVLVFSDSCHSGTVTKIAQYRAMPGRPRPGPQPTTAPAPQRFRAMPPDVAARVDADPRLRDFYRQAQEHVKDAAHRDVKATVLLISGCQDNQLSADGDRNGLFTEMLKWVYENGGSGGGRFGGDYAQFHAQILDHMPPYQSPNYYVTGTPNTAFERQRVFAI